MAGRTGQVPATAAGRQRLQILELELPWCALSWAGGVHQAGAASGARCKPNSRVDSNLLVVDGAAGWTANLDASNIRNGTAPLGAGRLGVFWDAGTGAAASRIQYTFPAPVDFTVADFLRVAYFVPDAAAAAALAYFELFLHSSAGGGDYYQGPSPNRYPRHDWEGRVVGWNYHDIKMDPADFVVAAGSPDLASVVSIVAGFLKDSAGTAIVGLGFGDLRKFTTPSGAKPCYNTLPTCTMEDGYEANIGARSFYYFLQDSPLGQPGYPFLRNVTQIPGKIDLKRGMSASSTMKVTLDNPVHGGEGMDDYPGWRLQQPGRHFHKLRDRFRYLAGKPARFYDGYTNEDGSIPSLAELSVRRFNIHKVDLSTSEGRSSLILVDPLVDLERTRYPESTEAELLQDCELGATSLQLTPESDTTDMPTGGGWYLRVNDEIMLATSRSGQVVQVDRAPVITRTVEADHEAEDGVQVVALLQGSPDAILKILMNWSGLADSILDLAGWADEVARWMWEYQHVVFVPRSTQVSSLVQDFMESINSYIWWDPEGQLVRFRHGRPPGPTDTVVAFDTRDVCEARSTTVKTDDSQRATRVTVVWDVRNWSMDLKKQTSYKRRVKDPDLAAESVLQYNQTIERLIYNYWMGRDLENEVRANAYRYVTRHRDPVRVVKWTCGGGLASTLPLGAFASVTTDQDHDKDGEVVTIRGVVIAKAPKSGTHDSWEYELVEETVFGRWWFWAEDTDGIYPLNEERAHWGDEDGLMPNGDEGYAWT